MNPSSIGHYEIRGELGRGAMAIVWRAWDAKLEREVAIKEPTIAAGVDSVTAEELAARFIREGRAAAALNHPGIVTVYAADIYDGRPAIVMELIQGDTLSSLMSHGPLGPETALAIADQLLDAVGFAHQRGVVHRDIKPDNVFVTADGRVKLTDFGIAHVGASAALTQAGTIMGTPGYMAPEQVTGAPVDQRADIFAIGVVLHEMLTGRNPFGATDGLDATTVMYRIVHEAPPTASVHAPALPASVEDALARALAKEPHVRFPDAAAFRAVLRGTASLQSGSSNTGAPVFATGDRRSSGSTWWPYVAVAGIGVFVFAALLISSTGPSGGRPAAGVSGSVAEIADEAPEPEQPTAAAAPLEVRLVSPTDSTSASLGDTINLSAETDQDERVHEVVFYVNHQAVGTSASRPFSLQYVCAESGDLAISATAVDVEGRSSGSATVLVKVESPIASRPEDAVVSYYETCNMHDAAAAYAHFSSGYKSRMAFNKYEETFSFFGHGDVETISVDIRGTSATVGARVWVTPRSGGSAQLWTGTFELVEQGGEWLIERMSLQGG